MLSPLPIPGNIEDAMEYPGLAAHIHTHMTALGGNWLLDTEEPATWSVGDGSRQDIEHAVEISQRPLTGADRLEIVADLVEKKLRSVGRSGRRPGGTPRGGPAKAANAAGTGHWGQFNNMAPPFSQIAEHGGPNAYLADLVKLPQGGGGIDWFEATGYGTWYPGLKAKLRTVQEFAQANGQLWQVIELANNDANSIAMLSERGAGSGYSHQPFVIQKDGITIGFGATEDSDGGTRPVCFVRATGTPFLQFGEAGVITRIVKLMRYLGINAHFKPSRIDLAIDLPGVSAAEFVNTWKEGQGAVSKTKKVGLYYDGSVPSGLVARSNIVSLTVYDKKLEVFTKSPEKLQDMIDKRWGCLPEHATRVEFKVRLSKLRKDRKPQSVEDCIRNAWRLFSWLSLKWFRLTTGVKDRTHTTRAKIAPVWQLMFHAAETVFGRLDQPLPEHGPAEVSKHALLAQFLGLAATVMAHTNHANPQEFFADVMQEAMYSSKFYSKLENAYGKRGISLRDLEAGLINESITEVPF